MSWYCTTTKQNKEELKFQNDGLSTLSLEFDLEVYLNCLIWLRLNVNEIFI